MMKSTLVATLGLGIISTLAAAASVDGYGPWRLGMSREDVVGVTSHGPYSDVASTGGVETSNAHFQGKQVNISFVFGPQGLRHIQVWAYQGQDFAAALEAFHDVYLYLVERFGTLHSDGRPVAGGLSIVELERLLPTELKTATSQSQLPELPKLGSIQAQIRKFHLHPIERSGSADVYGSLIHSPQLGLYWVFLYVKSPGGRS